MKKRTIAFLCALVICALAVMGMGAYLKYHVLSVVDMGVEYNIVELPFLMLTDEALRYTVEYAQEYRDELLAAQQPTEPEATDPPTDPPTEPTESTGGSTGDATDPPTAPPTDPPTDPPTEEPTMPPTTSSGNNSSDGNTTTEKYPEYDFSGGAVDSEWFSDVLFIGDSRVVGLRDYARSGSAEYFCSVGMTVFSVTKTNCADKNFSSQKLETLLASKTYGKIYIAFGINEAGYPTNSVASKYQELISMVRRYQPDATIILQSIMPVTDKYASGKSYFLPSHLSEINEKIKACADGEDILYADVTPYFSNSKGYLYNNITGDGCHPTAKYYRVWANWIAYIVGENGLDLGPAEAPDVSQPEAGTDETSTNGATPETT